MNGIPVKTRLFRALASSIVLLWTAQVGASDLLSFYQAARQYDPRFQAAIYEYEATREALPQAKAELLPSISLDVNYLDTRQDILSSDSLSLQTGISSYDTTSFSFRATQPIFRLASRARVSQAKAVVRRAQAELAAAEHDLMARAAEAYFSLLAARDTLSLTQAEFAAVGEQLDLVKARRRGGLANVTEEYEAQARYSLVEAAMTAGEYAVDDAYQALRELAGDAVRDIAPLKEEIPLTAPEPANVATWTDRALEQNYSLLAIREAETVSSEEIRLQRAAHFPTVDLVARHGNTDQGGRSISTGAYDADTSDISIQFSIPIYGGGAIRSKTRQAEQRFRKAQRETTALHRSVMRLTRAAFQGVLVSIRRVNALSASMTAQSSVLDGKRKGYKSGAHSLLDVLDAERNLYSIKKDLALARYDYLQNLLKLKRQAGTLSEADLEYINSMLVPGSTVEP